MKPRYSNIFWHQGVKIFEEKVLNTEKGRIRVDHLENDITKALLNLFEHCSGGVLKSFLNLINVKDAPGSFEFAFQVTNKNNYRQHRKKIMLCIVSDYTQQKSDRSYSTNFTIPDACVFNSDTAILIEAKTQSPLIEEQIDSHIKNYLGSDTKKVTITWEQISERFKNIRGTLKQLDQFLVDHFCQLLELIGIADFNGFQYSDFLMLNSIGKVSNEEFLDFKRVLNRKIDKFMSLLTSNLKADYNFKNFGLHAGKVALSSASWSSIYFYDTDPSKVISEYPKLNFDFRDHGIELSVNAEVKPTLNRLLSRIKQDPSEFEDIALDIGEFEFLLFYKLQYLPQNHFIWNLVPGFPQKMGGFKAEDIFSAIDAFGKDWGKFKKTLLFKMESGMERNQSGRPFNAKELGYATSKNPNPNYAIRIEKRYSVKNIDQLGKKVVPFFEKEVLQLKKLLVFLVIGE